MIGAYAAMIYFIDIQTNSDTIIVNRSGVIPMLGDPMSNSEYPKEPGAPATGYCKLYTDGIASDRAT